MSILKSRLGVRAALVVLIAVFALVPTQLTVHSQLGGLPQSPADSTVNTQETDLSDAQKDNAFSTLMDQGNLQQIGKSVGMDDPKNEWTHKKEIITKEGNTTNFRLSQVYNGIKVHNGNLTVQYKDGSSSPDLNSLHLEYVDDPQVDTNPKLSKAKAMQIARKLADDEIAKLGGPFKDTGNTKDRPDRKLALSGPAVSDDATLEVHPGGGKGKRKLSWHTSVKDFGANGPVQMEAWIDQDGNVLEAYNNAQSYVIGGYGYTGYQGLNGPGYGIGVFNLDYNAGYGGYLQNDNSYLIGVYDNYQTTGSTWQSNQCCSISFGNYSFGNRFTSNADTYVATVQTLSWMYYVLGRDFVDGNRGPRYYGSVSCCNSLITARNHVGYRYNNAFWDGSTMNIGDGDGNTFGPLATLDIIGHEWQHGVTQYTAGLNYSGESGALNEAFSDIMGSMTERYWRGESANTWKVGEESYTPNVAGDALRYLNAPWQGGQPWAYFSGIGGYDPHYGSGVANFAFYVASKGWGGVTGGVGPDAVRWVYYHALRDCMIPTDGFGWTRWCTQYEAAYWYGYGSSVYNAVRASWDFVGAPGPSY